MSRLYTRALNGVRLGLSLFRRDRRGVSAVEFALIAPVLILVYFGMVELSQAMIAQRRVSHSASAIGDLVANSNTVDMILPTSATNSNLPDLFSASSTILAPFATAPLRLRVSSVTGVLAKGQTVPTPTVDWCQGQNATCTCPKSPAIPNCSDILAGQKITLPDGLITAAGDNVILAEATYHYTSIFAFVLKNGLDYTERFYLRPRKVAMVPCGNCDNK